MAVDTYEVIAPVNVHLGDDSVMEFWNGIHCHWGNDEGRNEKDSQ